MNNNITIPEPCHCGDSECWICNPGEEIEENNDKERKSL